MGRLRFQRTWHAGCSITLRVGIVQLWLYPFIPELDVIGDADGADENWRPAISKGLQIL